MYVDEFSNIKFNFLPPNTTAIVQPMDQGVIAAFKSYYLRRTVKKIIESIDQDMELSVLKFWKNFNLLTAVEIIVAS